MVAIRAGAPGLGQDAAERGDVDREVVLLDGEAVPDAGDDLVLGEDALAAFDQSLQDVEGARADGGGCAVHEEGASPWVQSEAPEREDCLVSLHAHS